jgi:AcrR family transcriptional regulator
MPPRDRTRRRVIPSQARAHASIEAILIAAEGLLAEQGFAHMTTNRVARRAGVNVALVYRYFAGKEAIVGALIERAAGATLEAARQALAEHARSPFPAAVRALIGALAQTPGVPSLHRELVEHVDVTKRQPFLQQLRARMSALFGAFLTERAHELRAEGDREALVFVLQHAVEAATHAAAFYRPESLSLERALDAVTEVVTRALMRAEERRPERSP